MYKLKVHASDLTCERETYSMKTAFGIVNRVNQARYYERKHNLCISSPKEFVTKS